MKAYPTILALLVPNCTVGFVLVQKAVTKPTPVVSFKVSEDADERNNDSGMVRQIYQVGLAVAFSLAVCVAPAIGADFAGKDISGMDFSGQDLAGKDFSGSIAKGTIFKDANLQGASFQKANLVKSDFTGADLANTNYVDAVLDGTIFKDVTAQKSIWSASILDIKVGHQFFSFLLVCCLLHAPFTTLALYFAHE